MNDQLKYYISFIKNSNDCISLFTLDGSTIFVNKRCKNLAGFSNNDDFKNGSIEDFFNPETRTTLIEVGLPALFETGTWEGELQIEHCFTGQCIDVQVSLFFVNDSETGEPQHICMTQKDISGQKQTEQLIFEENQILDAFMDNLPDHIYVKDKNSRFMRVNKAMAKWLDLGEPESIIGKWDFDFYDEEYAVKAYTDELEIIEVGDAKKNIIEVAKRPDKDDAWVRTSKVPMYDSNGECIGIIGMSSDITDLIMAEKRVVEASKQTERLLASISSILIGVGPNEVITQWNAAAEHTFGIKEKDVVGKPFLKCGINWDWTEVLERIALSFDDEKQTKLHDIQFTRPDETNGFLDITINRIAEQKVEHAGYLLVATEITERKHLEGQLSNAQKLESIGQLAAGIAHEINTPIQFVGDNTHFLKESFGRLSTVLGKSNEILKAAKNGGINEKQIAEFESVIEENKMDYIMDEIPFALDETLGGVERVANIVKAMKEFSHPGAEEKTLTDLNKALESTITVSRNEWKYVAEMETDFDSTIPAIPCLPGELNQVFLNLIVNAAQAIGDVTKNGSEGMGKIKISTALQNDFVEIRIKDTGTGIPESAREKVFDPFFTTKEVGKGTGQGLAISHNVITEKHGGKLSFETEMGKGTTFVISLPITESV